MHVSRCKLAHGSLLYCYSPIKTSYLTKKAPQEPESLQYTKHLGGTVGAHVNSGLNPCRQRL